MGSLFTGLRVTMTGRLKKKIIYMYMEVLLHENYTFSKKFSTSESFIFRQLFDDTNNIIMIAGVRKPVDKAR